MALSIAFAEKSAKYERGEKPNAAQIGEFASEVIQGIPRFNYYGYDSQTIRKSINECINNAIGK